MNAGRGGLSITIGKGDRRLLIILSMGTSRKILPTAAILGALFFCATARADQPSVTAVLNNSETGLGDPVQLQIKVTGSSSAQPPSQIDVPGLDIRATGSSQHFEMRGFNVSSSIVYNYTVMPERAGTFKIPPQSVRIGSNTLQTPELTLHVANSTAAPRTRRRRGTPNDSEAIDPSKVGFVEMTLGRNEAYVGEMVPAQIRLGFSARVPLQSLTGIEITGQGFTTQKMPDARQTYDTLNGRTYQVLTYKTAISAARPGKFDIGPVEVKGIVRVPRSLRNQQIFPRDLFDTDDPFFDNFFNDPAFMPSVPKEVKLTSDPAPLTVKPLPPNAPPGFSGAVGTFELDVSASPTNVKVGDPLTVKAKIAGRGNFGRVEAPVLENKGGWHSYPPSDKFEQDDDVGISGVKTFEMVFTPNENKQQFPPLTFSFFDPVKERYVTLKSDPIPIAVTGGAAPTATAAPSAQGPGPTAAAPAASSPAPTSPAADILDLLPQARDWGVQFTPTYARPLFWIVQGLGALLLIVFVWWKVRQLRAGDREAQRIAALQEEAAQAERRLHGDLDATNFYAEATRAIRLRTAAAARTSPNSVDADLAARTFQVDEATRNRLRELFAQSDELRYSGSANGNGHLNADVRHEITRLLQQLRR